MTDVAEDNTEGGTLASPGKARAEGIASEDPDVDGADVLVLGCIPKIVSGDFGCLGSCGRNFKYWINPTVTVLAIIIIWPFVIWCAADVEGASEALSEAQGYVVRYFGWFYVAALMVFASFSVWVAFSRFGDIKLGPEDEPPKYTLMTWFSMLFSAGVGAGLYFFGVAEPLWHFGDMQSGSSRWYHLTTNQQAQEAMNITWFHWGFTASATYCAAGLPLAYHHHVKGEPLRESMCFMTLLGAKYSEGLIGSLIDLCSVVGTMFGVATSLGIGVLSVIGGLKYLFDIEDNLTNKLIVIWFITGFATVSVLTGLDTGIRRLSEVNFMFSFIILFFLFFALDPFFLLNLFVQSIGYHFQWMLELNFSTQAFEVAGFYDNYDGSNDYQTQWMADWTIFYWAWWIAWAPFVGIFIAQISRGRTIREFILGNMMVPTLLTCIWFTIFGGVGLYNEMGSIANEVSCSDDEEDWFSEFDGKKIVKLSCYGSGQDILFATFNVLPLSGFISFIAMIATIMYFVTSSDSASHIIDVLTAGGHTEPPKLQRVFWALSEGAVASVLLAANDGGGTSLSALQTASLVAALPFCVVLLFEVMATYQTLQVHKGEVDPAAIQGWTNHIFECSKKCPDVLLALLLPCYYQTTARINMVKNAMRNPDAHFTDNFFKWLWIVGFWLLWVMAVVFALLEFLEPGFLALGLSVYLFFIIASVINRGNIKAYYGIESGNLILDSLAWVVCCCLAAVQEDLESRRPGGKTEQLLVVDQADKAKGVVPAETGLAAEDDDML